MQRTSGMGWRRRLFLLVQLLLLLLFPGCCSAGRDADRAALLRFKRSVSSDPGGLLSRWSGADACSWPGVSCDARSRVVAINMSGSGSCGAVFPCSDPAAGLAGQLSPAIGGLTELRVLHLPFHSFSGEVPGEIWGLPSLEVLDLEGSSLSAVLPPRFPPGLRVLNLASNRIRGEIPSSLSSCVDLEVVDLSRNEIEGVIPASFGGLPKLRELRLFSNRLRGSIPVEIGDGCRCLEQLDLSGNLLVHSIPRSLGNCGELRSLLLRSNLLEGALPGEIGRLGKLQVLDVSRNRLRGFIPRELGSCLDLAVLVLSNPYHRYPSGGNPGNLDGGESNYFPGGIPANITSLPKLRMLWAPRSTSGGPIPSNWGACESLEVVNLGQNLLTGKIPAVLEQCKNLKHLNLSSNMLQGQISVGFGELKSLEYLLLAGNNLTGEIPAALGHLYSLKAMDLSSNALFGGIPDDFVNLRNLSVLLLHNNNLSGNIPFGAVDFRSISVFNMSFNNLSGTMPLHASRVRADSTLGEPFPQRYHIISHSTSPSDTQRRSLGSPTSSTPPPGSSTSKGKHGFSSIEIASITSAAAIVSVLLALIVLYVYSRKCVRRSAVQSSERREVTIFEDIGVPLTYETVLTATGGFNGSNCIGSGGFGATYKAEIAPGVLVAIKRLSVGRFQGLQQFHAEIKTLGRWRHPKLVTLIGYHISEAETFLIYNYLPGGNLEKFIKERSKRVVDWRMLHKIALDVAQALAYLHDHCQPRILHRDVKPSNILLDNKFNAYLSDFGLARLLGNSETHVTTGVAGTFGYVAPEYAMTCRVSDKADVYSYGVVLLELISDKKALDPSFSQFGNGFNIVAWAAMLLRQGQAREFFTDGLWDVGPHGPLVETLHLAVKCTDDSLSVRPTMKQVVQRLKQLQPSTGR